MSTLVLERDQTASPGDGKADAPAEQAPEQPRPMTRLATVRCAIEVTCVGLILALFLLRGLDAAIHG